MTPQDISAYSVTLKRRKKRGIRCLILSLLMILLLVALLAIWAFVIEPDRLTITRLTLSSNNLPAGWDGRTIAFFTDAHVGPSFDQHRLGRVADAIQSAAPDLILYGGDLIDSKTPEDEAFAAEISLVLSRMKAPFGQYAVAGNHDNRLIATLNRTRAMLEAGGFRLLVNQSVELDGLLLGGMDDSYFGQPDLQETFPADSKERDLFRILLKHAPDFAAALPADSADLVFSGHSHNGQVALFGRPLITVHQARRYTHGLYDLADGRRLVVSRGLGTVLIAARFGSPPEVMLITLRRS